MAATLDLSSLNILSRSAAMAGCDLETILSSLDIRPATQSAPFHKFSLAQIDRLLSELELQAIHKPFAFSFAQAFNFDGQPEVAAYLLSTHTLRDAHLIQDWIPRLIHPAIRLESAEQDDLSHTFIHVDDPEQQHTDMPAFVEIIAAIIALLCRQLAPQFQALKAVQFAHQRSEAASRFEAFFACPVSWEGKDNRMDFDSRVLDVKLPGSLPLAHAQAEEAIRQKLAEGSHTSDLASSIEKQLRQRLSLFSLGLEGLARELKMHPRSLQRQLRATGESYSGLLSRIRHRLACEMLSNSELDIESIGIKLGFTERRSFTHAFRKWQGVTPSHYRHLTQKSRSR